VGGRLDCPCTQPRRGACGSGIGCNRVFAAAFGFAFAGRCAASCGAQPITNPATVDGTSQDVIFSEHAGRLGPERACVHGRLWHLTRLIARVLDPGATDSGRPYFVLELVKGMPSGIVTGVAFSSDNRTFVSTSWDNTFRLWDPQARRADSLTERRSISLTRRVTSIALSPDGPLLAIGQDDGIALHDPGSGQEVRPFKRSPAPVPGLAFSPDSRHLISAVASDPAVKVWDVAAEKFSVGKWAYVVGGGESWQTSRFTPPRRSTIGIENTNDRVTICPPGQDQEIAGGPER
jgi:WD40 repeat protein